MARDIPFDAGRVEAEENLLIDAQFLIQELMAEKGVTRAQLAALTGLSVARLSQIMSTNANPTLKTLARIVHALGETVSVSTANELAMRGDLAVLAPIQWQCFDQLEAPASRQDVDMVSVVKRSFASNDNNGKRNVFVMEEEAA